MSDRKTDCAIRPEAPAAIGSAAYSSEKIFWHSDKLRALAEGRVTAPIYVRVKPTNRCNHRCYYCSYQEDTRLVTTETMNPRDEIPHDKLCEIIDDFRSMGVRALTFSGGGEPLIYPRLEEILTRVAEAGIEFSAITNGSRLEGELARRLAAAAWVRVSLDSADAANYARIRRVTERELPRVIGNLRHFSSIKSSDCELGVNFVVCAENAAEVYEACRLMRDSGANHIKLSARNTPDFHAYHEPFRQRVLDQIDAARRDFDGPGFRVHSVYAADFELAGVYQRAYSYCAIKEIVPVIGADCGVYFCHDKTYSNEGRIGWIRDRSFRDLWFAPETAERFRTFDAKVECRHHCTYDARNLALNQFLANCRRHVNFI